MQVFLTAAGKDTPLPGCCPVACHSIQHNLRARSGGNAINPMLKDFGLEEVPASEDLFLLT